MRTPESLDLYLDGLNAEWVVVSVFSAPYSGGEMGNSHTVFNIEIPTSEVLQLIGNFQEAGGVGWSDDAAAPTFHFIPWPPAKIEVTAA